jgi:hypothetical protein
VVIAVFALLGSAAGLHMIIPLTGDAGAARPAGSRFREARTGMYILLMYRSIRYWAVRRRDL